MRVANKKARVHLLKPGAIAKAVGPVQRTGKPVPLTRELFRAAALRILGPCCEGDHERRFYEAFVRDWRPEWGAASTVNADIWLKAFYPWARPKA